jgi:hypothetical protein
MTWRFETRRADLLLNSGRWTLPLHLCHPLPALPEVSPPHITFF